MATLEIDIDGRGISALADAFGPTEKQMNAAMRSTYAKMGRWMRTQSVRGMSSKLKIQQKILRSRIRTYRMQHGFEDGEGVKVWYGIKDIAFSRLKPRESGGGVKAQGGRFEKDAFIAKLYGRDAVLKRIGKERVPLRIVYAEIADQAITYIEDFVIGTTAFDAQFYRFLEHELKWRTSILK